MRVSFSTEYLEDHFKDQESKGVSSSATAFACLFILHGTAGELKLSLAKARFTRRRLDGLMLEFAVP